MKAKWHKLLVAAVALMLAVACCGSVSASVMLDDTQQMRGNVNEGFAEGECTSSFAAHHGGQIWFTIDPETADKTFTVTMKVQKEGLLGTWSDLSESVLSNPVTLSNTSGSFTTTSRMKLTASASSSIQSGSTYRYHIYSNPGNAFYGWYRNVMTTSTSWS